MRFRAVMRPVPYHDYKMDYEAIMWVVVASEDENKHYAMRGDKIAVFHTRTAAQKVADKLNKGE